jgi:hypothetical protein
MENHGLQHGVTKERHWIICKDQPTGPPWEQLASPLLAHGVAMVFLGFLATLASFCEFWVSLFIGMSGVLVSWLVTGHRACIRERTRLLHKAWTWKS